MLALLIRCPKSLAQTWIGTKLDAPNTDLSTLEANSQQTNSRDILSGVKSQSCDTIAEGELPDALKAR